MLQSMSSCIYIGTRVHIRIANKQQPQLKTCRSSYLKAIHLNSLLLCLRLCCIASVAVIDVVFRFSLKTSKEEDK